MSEDRASVSVLCRTYLLVTLPLGEGLAALLPALALWFKDGVEDMIGLMVSNLFAMSLRC